MLFKYVVVIIRSLVIKEKNYSVMMENDGN